MMHDDVEPRAASDEMLVQRLFDLREDYYDWDKPFTYTQAVQYETICMEITYRMAEEWIE